MCGRGFMPCHQPIPEVVRSYCLTRDSRKPGLRRGDARRGLSRRAGSSGIDRKANSYRRASRTAVDITAPPVGQRSAPPAFRMVVRDLQVNGGISFSRTRRDPRDDAQLPIGLTKSAGEPGCRGEALIS